MRTREFDGHRFPISFTKQVQEVMDRNVGVGKPFSRKSDLVNFCVLQVLGSGQSKTEGERESVACELQLKVDELSKLGKKHHYEEVEKAQLLCAFYGVPFSEFFSRMMEIEERARKDWDEHFNQCESCQHACKLSSSEEHVACWFDEKLNLVAAFHTPEEVLDQFLAAASILKLRQQIAGLRLKLRGCNTTLKPSGERKKPRVEIRLSKKSPT